MSVHSLPSEPILNPSLFQRLFGWLDADYYPQGAVQVTQKPKTIQLDRLLPFAILHLGCIGVIWAGWSPIAVAIAAVLYFVRIFFITGFYHRYFSHRTFKTNRFWQCVFAICGNSAVQKGALWWAAHHRHHHLASDEAEDLHSVRQQGFWWAHIGWMTTEANMPTHYDRIKDMAKYPELVWLNRFDWVVPLALFLGLFATGEVLAAQAPQLGTSGFQLITWGFFISTVFLFHGTCTINSLCHVFGNQRYDTGDDSKNNFWLACITLGEGWHNNHHTFPSTVRQGFYWWEIDPTFYVLKIMSWLGIIWDLKPVPAQAYEKNRTLPARDENPQALSQQLPA